jgi:hypothetical protein
MTERHALGKLLLHSSTMLIANMAILLRVSTAGAAEQLAEGPIVGPAHWAIGVSGLMAGPRGSNDEGKSETGLAWALGGNVMLREVQGPLGLYATGVALPVWAGIYQARAGVVLGVPYLSHYGYSYQSGSYQYTWTYAERVRSVIGLLGGGGFVTSPAGTRPYVELGLGWMGQHHFELSALYDPKQRKGGIRIAGYAFFGLGSLGAFFGSELQVLADRDGRNSGLILCEVGISDGID